jgi:hypothetical protein
MEWVCISDLSSVTLNMVKTPTFESPTKSVVLSSDSAMPLNAGRRSETRRQVVAYKNSKS